MQVSEGGQGSDKGNATRKPQEVQLQAGDVGKPKSKAGLRHIKNNFYFSFLYPQLIFASLL
jgi:hypothetical protein